MLSRVAGARFDALLAAAARLELPAGSEGWAPEVWLLDSANVSSGPADRSLLDGEERARAERLRDPEHRRRYVAAHGLLRARLAERLRTTPAKIKLVRQPCPHCGGPHGRPGIHPASGSAHFSLAYSGGLALVAIASGTVGADLEAYPERSTWMSVSPLLHDDEVEEIEAAAPDDRAGVFARLWARKEAYLKGEGTGIAVGLEAQYLGSDGNPPGWSVVDLRVPSGFAGALALPTIAAPKAGAGRKTPQ